MTLTPTTSPANAAPGDTPAPALTPRQEAFARHYAASGNGAAAARAAGYAPASAKQAAHELLQAPMIRDRVAALEEAHGRTLRGEAAVLLDRLDAALDLARLAGDYRAMLDVARLQAQVAALTGTDAAQRRALLYDRAGGPGPLVRMRDGLDPEAAIDPDARAAEVAATLAAERAEDEAAAALLADRAARRARADADRRATPAGTGGEAEHDAEVERAAILAGIAELEAELGVADPDLSLPSAGVPLDALPNRSATRPPRGAAGVGRAGARARPDPAGRLEGYPSPSHCSRNGPLPLPEERGQNADARNHPLPGEREGPAAARREGEGSGVGMIAAPYATLRPTPAQ